VTNQLFAFNAGSYARKMNMIAIRAAHQQAPNRYPKSE